MRLHGWQESLDAEFRAANGAPFRWGTHDCCQFAARCASVITGEDFLRHFVKYTCASEALGIMWALGGMKGLLDFAFGESKPVSFATTGDIVLIDMGRGEQPAVCAGLNCFAPGACAIVTRPTRLAIAAWTV